MENDVGSATLHAFLVCGVQQLATAPLPRHIYAHLLTYLIDQSTSSFINPAPQSSTPIDLVSGKKYENRTRAVLHVTAPGTRITLATIDRISHRIIIPDTVAQKLCIMPVNIASDTWAGTDETPTDSLTLPQVSGPYKVDKQVIEGNTGITSFCIILTLYKPSPSPELRSLTPSTTTNRYGAKPPRSLCDCLRERPTFTS